MLHSSISVHFHVRYMLHSNHSSISVYFHVRYMLYGNHVGRLRVWAERSAASQAGLGPIAEWETEGNQGKNWYQGHITVDAFDSFKVS